MLPPQGDAGPSGAKGGQGFGGRAGLPGRLGGPGSGGDRGIKVSGCGYLEECCDLIKYYAGFDWTLRRARSSWEKWKRSELHLVQSKKSVLCEKWMNIEFVKMKL